MNELSQIIVVVALLFGILFGVAGFVGSIGKDKPTDPCFAVLPIVVILAVLALRLL